MAEPELEQAFNDLEDAIRRIVTHQGWENGLLTDWITVASVQSFTDDGHAATSTGWFSGREIPALPGTRADGLRAHDAAAGRVRTRGRLMVPRFRRWHSYPPVTSAAPATPTRTPPSGLSLPDARIPAGHGRPDSALLAGRAVLADPRERVPSVGSVVDGVAPPRQSEVAGLDPSSSSGFEPGHEDHLPTPSIGPGRGIT